MTDRPLELPFACMLLYAAVTASSILVPHPLSAAQRVAALECAPVEAVQCYDRTSRQHSQGFRVRNDCDRDLRFEYRAHHKKENKSYRLTSGVRLGKAERQCGLTANSDQQFLHFILRDGESAPGKLLSAEDRVRKILTSIANADAADTKASAAMADAAFDWRTLDDSTDYQDFMNRAHRAFTLLQRLRNENASLAKNIPLRNAEYYAMGYYAGLSRDPQLSFGVDFGEVYMALKWAAIKIGLGDAWARSNQTLPTTPPGGVEWAQAGLRHGRVVRDTWVNTRDAKARRRPYPSD